MYSKSIFVTIYEIYNNNNHMSTITERWGFNEAERSEEDLEQVADFLMSHRTVPLKIVNLMVEGKT